MDDDKDVEHKAVSPKPASKKRGRGLRECIRPPFGKWLVLTIVVLMGAGFLCAGVSFITTPAQGGDGEKKPDFAQTPSVIFSREKDGVPTLVDTVGETTTMISPVLPTDPFGGVFHEKRDSAGDTNAQFAQGKEGNAEHTMLTARLTTTTSSIDTHFVYHTTQHTPMDTATEGEEPGTGHEAQPSRTSSAMTTSVPTATTSVGMVASPTSTGTDLSEVKYCPMAGSPDVYTPCDSEQRGVLQAPDSAVVKQAGHDCRFGDLGAAGCRMAKLGRQPLLGSLGLAENITTAQDGQNAASVSWEKQHAQAEASFELATTQQQLAGALKLLADQQLLLEKMHDKLRSQGEALVLAGDMVRNVTRWQATLV